MSGIEKGRHDAGCEMQLGVVTRAAPEEAHGRERIVDRVERPDPLCHPAGRMTSRASRFFLVHTRSVRQHQARKLTGGLRTHDLAAEAAIHEKRQTTAMIQVCVRQQNEIDAARLEAERLGVLLTELAPALKQAAIDQNAFAGALDEVTGAGHPASSPVKFNSHCATLRTAKVAAARTAPSNGSG